MLPSCTIYQSIGHSFGSFVAAPNGKDFQPVGYRWDYEHTALVYIYRPGSTWANDELESPSFYLNDEHRFNIRGNGYTWYELKPGTHKIVIRRPLMGLEGVKMGEGIDFSLKIPSELELNAKASHVYYLRYSEIDQDAANFEDMTFHKNPLQVVTPEVALAEIQQTKMLSEGQELIKSLEEQAPADDEVEFVPATTEMEDENLQPVDEVEEDENKDWSPF